MFLKRTASVYLASVDSVICTCCRGTRSNRLCNLEIILLLEQKRKEVEEAALVAKKKAFWNGSQTILYFMIYDQVICKTERSGSGGASKIQTNSNWMHCHEFSFMKQFFTRRRYTTEQSNNML